MTRLPPREAMSRGGRSRTADKLAALSALHASRRGRRINRPGLRLAALRSLFDGLQRVLRPPGPGRSWRALARIVKVSDRTVRRWRDDIDWPPKSAVAAIRNWMEK